MYPKKYKQTTLIINLLLELLDLNPKNTPFQLKNPFNIKKYLYLYQYLQDKHTA